MTFALPLAERRRHARNKRALYWRDPEYRLARINDSRRQRGAPPIASLDDMGDPTAGRRGAARDAKGRFVSKALATFDEVIGNREGPTR